MRCYRYLYLVRIPRRSLAALAFRCDSQRHSTSTPFIQFRSVSLHPPLSRRIATFEGTGAATNRYQDHLKAALVPCGYESPSARIDTDPETKPGTAPGGTLLRAPPSRAQIRPATLA